mmetsp:Transcript_74971/g.207556  ORF Transcript_74971/g.207556 Transcript_74971/m.207556 type:complete len:93 (+) Transcript_74971:51-329(+)
MIAITGTKATKLPAQPTRGMHRPFLFFLFAVSTPHRITSFDCAVGQSLWIANNREVRGSTLCRYAIRFSPGGKAKVFFKNSSDASFASFSSR